MMSSKKTLRGPGGLHLILDKSEIVPDDPGAGTPAIVEYKEFSSTYNAAVGEGELLGSRSVYPLSQAQLNWLAEVENEMEDFLFGG